MVKVELKMPPPNKPPTIEFTMDFPEDDLGWAIAMLSKEEAEQVLRYVTQVLESL